MSISVIPSNFLSIWWGSLTSTISYNTLNRAAAFCCLLLLYILLYLSLRFLFPHSPPSWFLSFFINSVFHYFPIIILSWHIFLHPIPWNFFLISLHHNTYTEFPPFLSTSDACSYSYFFHAFLNLLSCQWLITLSFFKHLKIPETLCLCFCFFILIFPFIVQACVP